MDKIIKPIDGMVDDIQIGYPRGIIMPNGEFVSNGNSWWIDFDNRNQSENKSYLDAEDLYVEVSNEFEPDCEEE